MQYYIAIIAGAVIYLLLQLNNVFNVLDFSWKTWMRTNLIPTVLNIVIGIVLVYFRESLKDIYPITELSAVMLGVSGQSVFKKLSAIFDRKIDTVVTI